MATDFPTTKSFSLSQLESNREEIAVPLATRAALRSLPIAILNGFEPRQRSAVLSLFRTAAAAHFSGRALGPDLKLTVKSAITASRSDVRFLGAAHEAVLAVRTAAELVVWKPARKISRENLLQKALRHSLNSIRALGPTAVNAAAHEYSVDSQYIVSSQPDTLARTLLWGNSDATVAQAWEAYAKPALLKDSEKWRLWINWYDALLSANPAAANFEWAVVQVPNELWGTGFSNLDDILQHLLDLDSREGSETRPFQPPVPTQKPAAIEPVILENGLVGLPSSPAEAELKSESVKAALNAVKEGFAELARDAEEAGNIDSRSIRELTRMSDRIPSEVPTQVELFRLGHVEALLNGYASTVNEEWPHLLAKKYHAINRLFDDTIRQFPEWREFKRNAAHDHLSSNQISAVSEAAALLAKDLDTPESRAFVAPQLPAAIVELGAGLTNSAEHFFSYAGHTLEVAIDLVESLSNTIKVVCRIALEAFRNFTAHYVRGIGGHLKGRAEGFEKRMTESGPSEGGKDADASTKWARRILTGGPWIALLLANFSHVAEWLAPILAHLKTLSGF